MATVDAENAVDIGGDDDRDYSTSWNLVIFGAAGQDAEMICFVVDDIVSIVKNQLGNILQQWSRAGWRSEAEFEESIRAGLLSNPARSAIATNLARRDAECLRDQLEREVQPYGFQLEFERCTRSRSLDAHAPGVTSSQEEQNLAPFLSLLGDELGVDQGDMNPRVQEAVRRAALEHPQLIAAAASEDPQIRAAVQEVARDIAAAVAASEDPQLRAAVQEAAREAVGEGDAEAPVSGTIEIAFTNVLTGESGTAAVQSVDPKAFSVDEAARNRWQLELRQQLASEKGWSLEDTFIEVLQVNPQSPGSISPELAALLDGDREKAHRRYMQDKEFFLRIAALCYQLRRGQSAPGMEERLMSCDAIAALEGANWKVKQPIENILALIKQDQEHSEFQDRQVFTHSEDENSKHLVRKLLETITTASEDQQDEAIARVLSLGPPEMAQDMLTMSTSDLREKVLTLAGGGFASVPPRVASFIARHLPDDNPAWHKLNTDLEQFESRGWRTTTAVGLLKCGVRDFEVLTCDTDPRSATLVEYMRRLVLESEGKPVTPSAGAREQAAPEHLSQVSEVARLETPQGEGVSASEGTHPPSVSATGGSFTPGTDLRGSAMVSAPAMQSEDPQEAEAGERLVPGSAQTLVNSAGPGAVEATATVAPGSSVPSPPPLSTEPLAPPQPGVAAIDEVDGRSNRLEQRVDDRPSLFSGSDVTGSQLSRPAAAAFDGGGSLTDAFTAIRHLAINTGQVTLGECVGRGSFGVVYMGTYMYGQCRREVAFKHIGPSIAAISADQEAVRGFCQEATVLQRLSHKNLVELLGVNLDASACDSEGRSLGVGLCLEYCSHGSLRRVLDHRDQYTLPWEQRMDIVKGILEGMEYLYSRIPAVQHRDLKSMNVLIARDFTPKICGCFPLNLDHSLHVSSAFRT